jgi:hypothetical protein
MSDAAHAGQRRISSTPATSRLTAAWVARLIPARIPNSARTRNESNGIVGTPFLKESSYRPATTPQYATEREVSRMIPGPREAAGR